MQAQELRIGNWVEEDVLGYCQIAEISTYSVRVKAKNLKQNKDIEDVYYSIILNNIQPIPLTPEILEKCGLKNVWIKESWMIIEDVSDGQLFGWAMKVRNADHTKEIEFAYFKYLHQLQNLYFALTGEELEVML